MKNGDGSLVEGEGTKPDVTIIVADADFVQLAAGKLDAQKGSFSAHHDVAVKIVFSILLWQTQGQRKHHAFSKIGSHSQAIMCHAL